MLLETCTSVTGLVDPSPITGRCAFCGKVVVGKINHVDAKTACDLCLEAASKDFLDDRVLLTRGLILGGVAAIVYFLILACLDVLLDGVRGPSFMTLPVGFIVGRAFAMGSKGSAGLKFRLAPVIISYLTVAMAAIPVLIMHAVENTSTSPVWLNYVLVKLPLWAMASPFVVESGRGLFGMLSLTFLAVGLVVAWHEAAVVPKRATVLR
jgi:hypothetical protein